MPRLRHRVTGVVVNVDDVTAELLDGYEPLGDQKRTVPRKPSSNSTK